MRLDQAGKTAVARPRRSHAERSAETRARVIQATIQCMCEVGYAEASTTLIAERAGLSRGALQHQFPTRNDLLLAVIEYMDEEFRDALRPELQATMTVTERIEKICRTFWRVYRSDAYSAQLQIWIGARHDHELELRLESAMRSMVKADERRWREAFADLRLPLDVLMAVRRLTLSAIRGHSVRTFYRPDRREWPEELQYLCSVATQLLVNGRQPRRSRHVGHSAKVEPG